MLVVQRTRICEKLCEVFEDYDLLQSMLCGFASDGRQCCVDPTIPCARGCSIAIHDIIAFTAARIASALRA